MSRESRFKEDMRRTLRGFTGYLRLAGYRSLTFRSSREEVSGTASLVARATCRRCYEEAESVIRDGGAFLSVDERLRSVHLCLAEAFHADEGGERPHLPALFEEYGETLFVSQGEAKGRVSVDDPFIRFALDDRHIICAHYGYEELAPSEKRIIQPVAEALFPACLLN
jgi:hypothetical protein